MNRRRVNRTVSRFSFRVLSSTLLLVLISQSAFSNTKQVKLQDLASGPPALMKELGAKNFVPFEVEGLAHASVAYIDYDYFRARGVEIPANGIQDAQFQKDALDAFAWMTHRANDPADAFNGKTRTLNAYYYGGYGMNGNIGSGRSAALGGEESKVTGFDIKGLPTSLIKSKDIYHSNGAVQTIEAVDEAIWSRILSGEVKNDANRVVAVIFTGTYSQIEGEANHFPRALIVREMATRPATYMLNEDREAKQDMARVKPMFESLLAHLPYPNNVRPKNDGQALRAGVLELAHREALTQAELFAKRIYFGSNSPSNLEISGRRLDLGGHTAGLDYTKIFRLDDDSPFGETEEFKKVQADFRSSLVKTVPKHMLQYIPTEREVSAEFDGAYSSQRAIELVKLTGVPLETLSEVESSHLVRVLGDILNQIADSGNTHKVFIENSGYEHTSKYSLAKILTSLAAAVGKEPSELDAAISGELKDAPLRATLVAEYSKLMTAMQAKAATQEISKQAFKTYVREAAEIRNRNRTSLILGDTRYHELWGITDRAMNDKNGVLTQTYIENQINSNRLNFKDAAPFQLVTKFTENAKEGWSVRRVFDLKLNRHVSVIRFAPTKSSVYFRGQRFTAEEIAKAKVEVELANGSKALVSATESNGAVEFQLGSDAGIQIRRVQVVKEGVQSTDRFSLPVEASSAANRASICRAAF